MSYDVNLDEFEREWVTLAEDTVHKVFVDDRVQSLKTALGQQGFLTLEQKNTFITVADEIKSALIKDRYGAEDSEGYAKFRMHWEQWQKERGSKRLPATDKFHENVNHFLYGSTPNPEIFLKDLDLHYRHNK